MQRWVDLSTILAAIAGLWAIAFAWLTYVMTTHNQNKEQFIAIKSIIVGLRVELGGMKDWTGAGGSGYSKSLKTENSPPEWANPTRLIWKFNYDTVKNLATSPFVFHLQPLLEPFARLNFSVSRLFQFYDEYRTAVSRGPDPRLSNEYFLQGVLQYNYRIHVGLIGGQDSDDPACLYKAYARASDALAKFDAQLRRDKLPGWYWLGHVVSVLCFFAGLYLFCETVGPYLLTALRWLISR